MVMLAVLAIALYAFVSCLAIAATIGELDDRSEP
jgi:hypothetical protein